MDGEGGRRHSDDEGGEGTVMVRMGRGHSDGEGGEGTQ